MNNDTVTKMTRILQRDDGSEARIVVEAMFGEGLHMSIDTMVFRRASSQDHWQLCSDRPHPDWLTMPVDEYLERGRSEMLQTVSHGEILSLTQWIGQPISALPKEFVIA